MSSTCLPSLMLQLLHPRDRSLEALQEPRSPSLSPQPLPLQTASLVESLLHRIALNLVPRTAHLHQPEALCNINPRAADRDTPSCTRVQKQRLARWFVDAKTVADRLRSTQARSLQRVDVLHAIDVHRRRRAALHQRCQKVTCTASAIHNPLSLWRKSRDCVAARSRACSPSE